jgi:hypothetical protein
MGTNLIAMRGLPVGHRNKPIHWLKEGECIRCTSHALGGPGYPEKMVGGVHSTIPRIIASRFKKLAKGLCVRHTCDNRWCINPSHLIVGTQTDNMRDMNERGRTAMGENNGKAKLTSNQVLAIRNSTEPQRVTAVKYGVSQSLVSRIRARQWWKHV